MSNLSVFLVVCCICPQRFTSGSLYTSLLVSLVSSPRLIWLLSTIYFCEMFPSPAIQWPSAYSLLWKSVKISTLQHLEELTTLLTEYRNGKPWVFCLKTEVLFYCNSNSMLSEASLNHFSLQAIDFFHATARGLWNNFLGLCEDEMFQKGFSKTF